MLDQTLKVLSRYPNIDAYTLARRVADLDLQDVSTHNEARRFRRHLANAVRDNLIACDHVRAGDSLMVTYRLLSDEVPGNAVPPAATAPVPAKRTTAAYPKRVTESDIEAGGKRWGNAAVKPDKPAEPSIATVAQLEQVVEAQRSAVSATRVKREAGKRPTRPLVKSGGPARFPEKIKLKLSVLRKLAEITSDDISEVLREIADDLRR